MATPLEHDVGRQGFWDRDLVVFLENARDVVNELQTDHATNKTSHDAIETLIEELHDDHATFKTVVDALKTLANSLRTYMADGMLVHGTLAISAGDATKFKTTTTAVYTIAGVTYTKAATDALTFTAAHEITASKFGAILIQIDAAGTVSTKVVGALQAYDSAALALAALPAADTNNVAIGYIAIENIASTWTASTDDLTNASDVTTATFNNTVVKALPAAVSSSAPATLTASKPASGPATLTNSTALTLIKG